MAVFIVSAVSAAALIWSSEKHRVQEERSKAASIAGDYAHVLQQDIERALSSTYALAALVRKGNGRFSDFDDVAREMLPFYPGAILQIAPDGIVKSVIPLAGNEVVIGHDLLKDPARTKEAFIAKKTGKLTLAGPFKLIQGGTGAVGRLPVFLDKADGSRFFWGFTIALIRFPEVLEPQRLAKLVAREFKYELWRINPDTGKKQIIAASTSSPLSDPVEQTLEVPNGVWTLSVAPLNGWGAPLVLAIKIAMGLIFSLMLGFVALLLVKVTKSEERFKALHDATFGGIIIHEQGLILDCNQSLFDMTGFTSDQLIGMDGLMLIAPESRDLVIQHMRRGFDQRYEVEGVRKDGTKYPLSIKGKKVTWQGRDVQVSEFSDITDIKQAEQAREEALARVRKLEGIIPICSYCKKIRDDQNIWHQLESYIMEHSEASFSHGMCPRCLEKHRTEQMK